MNIIKKIKMIFIVAIVLGVWICTAHKISKRNSIFNYSENIWNVYSALAQEGGINSEGVPYLAMQNNGRDYVNYWVQGCKCIRLLREYNSDKSKETTLEEAKSIMGCFMNTWENYNKFPRPAYAEFDDGWVSCMDAPTIMVASQMMFELTGEERYRKFVIVLKEYVRKAVSEGGFNLNMGNDTIWPLEYTAMSTNADDAYFVENGSIVGFIGCTIIADLYQDKELKEYLEKVAACYESRFQLYRYEKYDWSYYRLNPLTVIPPHYMIFEMKLFDAAYELTNLELFEKGKLFRQDAIKGVLQLEFTELEGGRVRYVMHRACAPHPYLIDVLKLPTLKMGFAP